MPTPTTAKQAEIDTLLLQAENQEAVLAFCTGYRPTVQEVLWTAAPATGNAPGIEDAIQALEQRGEIRVTPDHPGDERALHRIAKV